jgi:mitochondrial import inner membrane translocase subunit TIM50
VDTKAEHAKYQPENSIILPPWEGKANDKGLVNLIPFLEYIAAMGIPDVREAIKSFEGKDIPTEFARREALAREKFNAQMAEERAKKSKYSIGGSLMSALGLRPQHSVTADGQSLAEGFEQGKMLSDQARERGQKQYEIMEKELRENSEKWLKEMEAEEKKMQEEWMKGMKSSFSLRGMFGGGSSEEKK